MTPAYFDKVRPTYIENWSPALTKLSIPQTDIPLSSAEARALGLANKKYKSWFEAKDVVEPLDQIKERLAKALQNYPSGAFVRLGSRSGKDSAHAQNRGLRVIDAESAIKMLTDDSQRIAFDLRLALKHNYAPHIFVRRWLDIPAWSEFRCFMKERKLVGISQYDYKNLGRCPEIVENLEKIRTAIELFFKKIEASSHLDDVVFDVFVEINKEQCEVPVAVTLLELNPFFEKTDACLFSWRNGGDFDSSFRVI